MHKKTLQPILDSRHLKIVHAKKSELKDSVVFIWLDEDKYGCADISQLRQLTEQLDKLEPSGVYILGFKKFKVNIFDRADIKNKDLIITIDCTKDMSESEVEDRFRKAFSDARNIKFVHNYAEIE